MAKASKRVKPDSPLPTPVGSWQEADEILRRMGALQGDRDKFEADATAEIAEIKKRTASVVAVIDAKLNHGDLGWRKSTAIAVKKTTLGLIKSLLRGAKRDNCLNIKETVNKPGLAKLTDDDLASLDARRVIKDEFYAEPFLVQVADYGKEAQR